LFYKIKIVYNCKARILNICILYKQAWITKTKKYFILYFERWKVRKLNFLHIFCLFVNRVITYNFFVNYEHVQDCIAISVLIVRVSTSGQHQTVALFLAETRCKWQWIFTPIDVPKNDFKNGIFMKIRIWILSEADFSNKCSITGM